MEPKDLLYKAIAEYGEKRILSDIAQGESPVAISAIFEDCITNLEEERKNDPEIRGALAEGLMHYMLTVSLIPSQRKTVMQSVDIDVAVPDTKSLTTSPEKVIVISFPKTNEVNKINAQIEQLKKIQPKSENIWVVTNEPTPIKGKIYTLDKNEFTFSNIINDLINFSSGTKQSKLKIFRI